MPTIIACFIAGICTAGFILIWFKTAYTELSQKRNCLKGLEEQLQLHERLYAQAKYSSDICSANKMMEVSRMLYYEASKGYNRILTKPMNRLPALLMGFRTVDEELINVGRGDTQRN